MSEASRRTLEEKLQTSWKELCDNLESLSPKDLILRLLYTYGTDVQEHRGNYGPQLIQLKLICVLARKLELEFDPPISTFEKTLDAEAVSLPAILARAKPADEPLN